MIKLKISVKGREKIKNFNSLEDVKEFIETKGYIYDNIDDYYWRLDSMMGWMVKAEIIK